MSALHRTRPTAALTLGCAMFMAGALHAQVSVTGSTGANGTYSSLWAAFAAINGSAQTGNAIVISLSGNTNEPAQATLYGGTWLSMTVQPTGGGARTISGSVATGGALIHLDGADKVTFDGLNTGGNSLTISNPVPGSSAGTCTVLFSGGANNNTFTNCSILGCSQTAPSALGGTILFTHTGNDNNVISFCNIGPASGLLPTKAVMSLGSNGTAFQYNDGNQLLNNNIYDYFSATAQSNAIYLDAGTAHMTISNNRFYQTAPRTQTVGNPHVVILLAHPNNANHVIADNIIGFANAAGTGTYTFNGADVNSRFTGIGVTAHSTTPGTSVRGNTIAGIAVGGTVGGSGVFGAFVGIGVLNGQVYVGELGGNTIGSLVTPGSIQVSFSSGGNPEVYGICMTPPYQATVAYNNVGGIDLTNSAGSATLVGIRTSTTAANTVAIINNTVGTAAAPLVNNSTGTASRVIGIQSGLGIVQMTNNTVSDLSMSAANTGAGLTACMIGLSMENGATGTLSSTVAQNTVRRLTNTGTGIVSVVGLLYAGPTTVNSTVARNLVHNLSTGSFTGAVTGIAAYAGGATYANNMVRLGITDGGGQETLGRPVTGILHAAGNATIVHNSVYIGGAPTTGGNDSYALYSSPTTGTRTYRDNIFFNARSDAGGGGSHFAIRAAIVDGVFLSNNNVLRAPGVNGIIGRLNATDTPTLAQWRAFTGQDLQSLTTDPNYAGATAALPDLHIISPTPIESAGAALGITNDFDGQTRASLTPNDIGADAGNFTPLCNGAPAAGSSSGPTTACAGEQKSYANNAVNTAGGITYAWYASTSSPSGPWALATGTGVNTQNYTTAALPSGTRYIVMSAKCTNTGDSTLSNVINLVVGDPDCNVVITIRAALEGSYNAATGLMSDALRAAGLVPLTEPYTPMGHTYVGHTGGTTTLPVLALTGADAVHDWVIAELRSSANPAIIIASRSALIQRDGELVDVDGAMPLTFHAPAGSYYVAVRHRNHLGAMSAGPIAFTPSPSFVDMAAPGFFWFGTAPVKSISGTFPAQALWAGDVSFSGDIKYTGVGNDRDPILVTVGSTTPNNVVPGTYATRDVNMDGQVKYTGTGNDRDPILVNVGSTTPNNVRTA